MKIKIKKRKEKIKNENLCSFCSKKEASILYPRENIQLCSECFDKLLKIKDYLK